MLCGTIEMKKSYRLQSAARISYFFKLKLIFSFLLKKSLETYIKRKTYKIEVNGNLFLI